MAFGTLSRDPLKRGICLKEVDTVRGMHVWTSFFIEIHSLVWSPNKYMYVDPNWKYDKCNHLKKEPKRFLLSRFMWLKVLQNVSNLKKSMGKLFRGMVLYELYLIFGNFKVLGWSWPWSLCLKEVTLLTRTQDGCLLPFKRGIIIIMYYHYQYCYHYHCYSSLFYLNTMLLDKKDYSTY